MIKHVAIYARLSPRPDGGYEGVDLQTQWGRAYAADAWPGVPVLVFADAGISAANGDRRPGYEALREAIARGEIAHLWAVEQSRLERREVHWFTLAAELDAAGIGELHTNRDGIVSVRSEVAGIKAVLAAGEVRKMKRRVNDRLAEIAAEGRPAGGRPAGYIQAVDARGGRTLQIVEAEAAVIRDAAEKILTGWSLARIAAGLRAQGLHGPHQRKVKDAAGETIIDEMGRPVTRPTTITGGSIRSWLTNPTVAGLRVHRGRIVGKGVWEPILDEAVWYAVADKLAAPRVVDRIDGGTYPVSAVSRSTGRRYLLTGGTAVCGVCNHALVASMKQMKRGRRPSVAYYFCHPKTGGGGCVGIMAERLEAHVVDALLDKLARPEFLARLTADDNVERRDEISTALRSVEAKRSDLANMWAAGELTAPEWQTARTRLAEQEQALRLELAAVPVPIAGFDPGVVRSTWPVLNLDERREIIGLWVESVVVSRARPGTKGFDPGRVAIAWRVA